MIPLMRPMVPRLKDLEPYLKKSEALGQFTNFGPVWWEAVKRLNRETGRFCLPVANATVALELMLRVRFAPGTRILVPDFTHAASVISVLRAGMTPIMCPVHQETWTLDLDSAASRLDEFDAMMVVSPFGYHVDFSRYSQFSELYGVEIVYDLAGAWGMPLHECDSPAVFSFHSTKSFSCGEGGVIAFTNDEDWEKGRCLSNFDTQMDRYIASQHGANYKIDEFKAAMICSILDRKTEVRSRIEHRRQLIDYYQDELSGYVQRHELHKHPYSSPSLCVLGGLPARMLEQFSSSSGVGFRRYYIPLTEMPGLNGIKRIGSSHDFFQSCVAFPSDATDEELDVVVNAVRECL